MEGDLSSLTLAGMKNPRKTTKENLKQRQNVADPSHQTVRNLSIQLFLVTSFLGVTFFHEPLEKDSQHTRTSCACVDWNWIGFG